MSSYELVLMIFNTPGFLNVLTGMIFVAILLGGSLAYGYGDVIRWLVVVAPYLFFVEWGRTLILTELGRTPAIRPYLLVMTTLLFYSAGLLIGVLTVRHVREPYVKKRDAVRESAKEKIATKAVARRLNDLVGVDVSGFQQVQP